MPKHLSSLPSDSSVRIRYYLIFLPAIPVWGVCHPRVTHQSATLMNSKLFNPVRLACLRRAASVRSEPGSNSPWLFQSPKAMIPNINRLIQLYICWIDFQPSLRTKLSGLIKTFALIVLTYKNMLHTILYVSIVSFPELSNNCVAVLLLCNSLLRRWKLIYTHIKKVSTVNSIFFENFSLFFAFFLLFTWGFCGSFEKGLGRIIKVENRPPGSL